MKTEFIEHRQKEFIRVYPYMEKLFNFLENKIKNSMVVPMPETEEEILNLLNKGILFENNVQMKEMKRSKSHQNSFNLVKRNPKIYKFVTGYGYTKEDNMWRQHSWVIRISDNTIIETTVKRDSYFGYYVENKDIESLFN